MLKNGVECESPPVNTDSVSIFFTTTILKTSKYYMQNIITGVVPEDNTTLNQRTVLAIAFHYFSVIVSLDGEG